jgi:hypothetical protein
VEYNIIKGKNLLFCKGAFTYLDHFAEKLNHFLLTYDISNKTVIDIFNDFIHSTKEQYSSEDIPKCLEIIENVKQLSFGTLVSDAEISSIIPTVLAYNLKERQYD